MIRQRCTVIGRKERVKDRKKERASETEEVSEAGPDRHDRFRINFEKVTDCARGLDRAAKRVNTSLIRLRTAPHSSAQLPKTQVLAQ